MERDYFASAVKLVIDNPTAIDTLSAELINETKFGVSLLHLVVETGNEEAIKALLKRVANTNIRDATGATPLHYSVLTGNAGIVKLLVDSGIHVDCSDSLGQTPLHCSCMSANIAIARLLIASGASVNAADRSKKTPLHFAVTSHANHKDCLTRLLLSRLLIESGANVEPEGVAPPLWLAITSRPFCPNLVRFLLKSGANPRCMDFARRNRYAYERIPAEYRAQLAPTFSTYGVVI